MSARALLLKTVVVVAASASLGLDGGFRGCGPESPPSGTPLPTGTPLECVADSDCEAPMCQDASCVAGRCVLAPVMLDADLDGSPGAPCGPDCDDRNRDVFPGATELCDGIDNDCDGSPDEGAVASLVRYEIGASILAAASVPTLPGVILVSATPTPTAYSLEARWFDLGPAGAFAMTPISDLVADDAIVVAQSVPEGARIVWASPSERAVREATITVSHTGAEVRLDVSAPTTVFADLEVVSMRLTDTRAGYALLLDELVAATGTRRRVLAIPGSALVPLPYLDGPFDLASRDARFYTPSSDMEVAVIDETGFELRRVVLPGPLASDAVATWNGRVLTVSQDFADFTVRELAPDDAIGDAAPLVGLGEVQLHGLTSSLAITRSSSGNLDLYLHDESLFLVESYAFVASSSSGLLGQRTVLDTSEGIAVVTTLPEPEGSIVAAIGCRSSSP